MVPVAVILEPKRLPEMSAPPCTERRDVGVVEPMPTFPVLPKIKFLLEPLPVVE